MADSVGEVLTSLAAKSYGGPLGERMPVIRRGDREPIPAELRFAVAFRDGYRCTWCWSTKPLEVDHVIPWSAGGLDIDTNLRLLCGPCNQIRSNRIADADTARPTPITVECIRCTYTPADSTITEAFCLVCGRLCPTRRDQLKLSRRHVWLEELSWSGWQARVRWAWQEQRWPLELFPTITQRRQADR